MQCGLVMCVCCTGQLTREPLPCQAPPGFCNRGEVRYGSIGGLRGPPVPVVLSVYQRGSLLDGLAMYYEEVPWQ